MMIPTVTRTTEEMLRDGAAHAVREAALALACRTGDRVTLDTGEEAASPGIITALHAGVCSKWPGGDGLR